MKCYKCKTILEREAVFCPKCGVKVKRKYFLRILLFFLLIVLFLCIGFFVYYQQEKKNAREAVIEFLEAYQRADELECGKFLYNNFSNAAIEFSETEKLLAKGVGYKIGECQWGDGKMCVKVEIENMDFQQVFEALLGMKEDIAEDELNSRISQVQEKGENRRSFECDVFVYKVDGEWKVSMTEELSNALHGGLNEYVDSAINGEVEQ